MRKLTSGAIVILLICVSFLNVFSMSAAAVRPDIIITDPLPGEILSGVYTFSCEVGNYDDVDDVELRIDGFFMGYMTNISTSNQYEMQIDTTAWEDGSHNVNFYAVGPDGSDAVTVSPIFDNYASSPADIIGVSPSDETTQSGYVNFTCTVANSADVDHCELSIDGNNLGMMTALPGLNEYYMDLNTTAWSDGVHTINYFAEGLSGTDDSVTTSISFDNYASLSGDGANIYDTTPASGETINGVYNFTCKSKYTNTSYVELSIGGTTIGKMTATGSSNGYYMEIDTDSWADGTVFVNFFAEGSNDQQDDSETFSVIIDNDSPILSGFEVTYPPGQEAAKIGGEANFKVEASDTLGVKDVFIDCSAFNQSAFPQIMYDDGLHDDLYQNDSVYGSIAYIIENISTSGYYPVKITVNDIGNNTYIRDYFLKVDEIDPSVDDAYVEYPGYQTQAKDGDEINVVAEVSDFYDPSTPGGVLDVTCDLSSLGGTDQILYDDGSHGDVLPDDGIYGTGPTEVFTSTGQYEVNITVIDIGGNFGHTLLSVYMDNTAPILDGAVVEYPNSHTYVSDGQEINITISNIDDSESLYLDASSIGAGSWISNESTGAEWLSIPVNTGYDTDTYQVTIYGYDDAGNQGMLSVNVDVKNYVKDVEIIQPLDGSNISGDQNIKVVVGDGIVSSDLYVDSVLVDTNNSIQGGNVSFVLDTENYDDGVHIIKVVGKDNEGGEISDLISTTFDNDAPLLQNLQIHYPDGGDGVLPGESVYVTVELSDGGTGINSTIVESSFASSGTLNDDGAGNDEIAGDGIYTSGDISIDPAVTEGSYTVYVNATDFMGYQTTITGYCDVYSDDSDALVAEYVSPTSGSYQSSGFTVSITTMNSSSAAEPEQIKINTSQTGSVYYQTTYNSATSLWEYNFPEGTFSDGLVTIYLNGTNVYGVYCSEKHIDVYVDTQSPTLQVYNPMDMDTISGSYSLAVNASDSISGIDPTTVKYDVDGGSSSPLSPVGGYQFNYNGILDTTTYPDGVHTITFSAGDFSGLTVTKSVDMIIDNDVDGALTCDIINPNPDEYVSGTYNVQVMATDGQGVKNVTLAFDGTYIPMPYNSQSGYYECTINTATKSDGMYGMNVTAYDNAENSAADMVSFYIDNTAPNPGFIAPTSDEIIKLPTYYVFVYEPDIFVNRVELSVDGGTFIPMFYDAGSGYYTTSIDFSMYPDGEHTLTVRTTDNASHVTENSVDILLDLNGPSCSIVSPLSGEFIEGEHTIKIQAEDSNGIDYVNFTMWNLDMFMEVLSSDCYYNSERGLYEYQVNTKIYPDGNYSISANSVDNSGNITSDSRTFRIDNNAPSLSVNSPSEGDEVYGTYVVDVTVLETFQPVTTEYSIDGGGWMPLSIYWDTTSSSDGAHEISVRATDLAGHETITTNTVYVNNNNPTCSIVSPMNDEYLDGVKTLKFSVSDSSGIDNVEFDITNISGPVILDVPVNKNTQTGYWEYDLDTAALSDGDYDIQVTATDVFGNYTTSSSITFKVDNNDPTVTINAPSEGDEVYGNVNIVASISDTYLSVSEQRIDSGAWVAAGTMWDTTSYSDGEHVITVRAEDEIGNVATSTVTVYVNNNDPSCSILSPSADVRVSGDYTLRVSASDDVGIDEVVMEIVGDDVSAGYNSGTGYYEYTLDTTSLSDGTYLLNVTTYDDLGNSSFDQVQFHIDNNAPVLSLTAPSEGDILSGTINIQSNAEDPFLDVHRYKIDDDTWADNGTQLDTKSISDGEHTLTVNAQDLSGHTSEISVTVYVDNALPNCDVMYPGKDSVMHGIQVFKVNAYDGWGVDMVYIEVDGVNHTAVYNEGIYEITVDTNALGVGSHSVKGWVRDSAGKWNSSSVNTFTVGENPENADQDGDGIPDIYDEDIDGDGVGNSVDAYPYDPSAWSFDPVKDTDGDGISDLNDTDIDGDGVSNTADAFPENPNEWADMDGDGIGDNSDIDIDGDGVNNDIDYDPHDSNVSAEPLDSDGDGVTDLEDDDRDGDSIPNSMDAFPDDPNEWVDKDGDGIGDNSDSDIDGDGVANDVDKFPYDEDEWKDSDGDGIGDNSDGDRDGDGYLNEDDDFPDNPDEWKDSDGDGIGDNSDNDRDGDGYPNSIDAFPDDAEEWRDTDGDGIGDNEDSDDDGDSIWDNIDAFPLNANEWNDRDGDGIGDNSDLDIDGDGIMNEFDKYPYDSTKGEEESDWTDWIPTLILIALIILIIVVFIKGQGNKPTVSEVKGEELEKLEKDLEEAQKEAEEDVMKVEEGDEQLTEEERKKIEEEGTVAYVDTRTPYDRLG